MLFLSRQCVIFVLIIEPGCPLFSCRHNVINYSLKLFYQVFEAEVVWTSIVECNSNLLSFVGHGFTTE